MDERLSGRRVTVMGLGRFGGGLGVTRFLAERGARVVVTDRLDAGSLREGVEALRPLVESGRVTLRLGGHEEGDFAGADVVVANPAVARPWEDRYLRAAAGAGVRITTEIGLLVERLTPGARVVGITGSAGKSTTTALTAHVLRGALGEGAGRRVWMGGNIGGSLLGDVGSMRDGDIVVLELSSAMLWWLGGAEGLCGTAPGNGRGLCPLVGVVTSFAANHLDWHGSEGHYEGCKRALLGMLEPGSLAILGPGATGWETPAGVERLEVCEDGAGAGCDLPELLIPGAHNARNARMALAAAGRACPEAGWGLLCAGASTFAGLAHRLCLVHRSGSGIRFYDDSKSTVPGATVLALEALGPASVHLIAGGYDKGLDLSAIAGRAGSLAGLYTIGATGAGLAESARRAGGAAAHVEACGTLEAAMSAIQGRALPGDVVLLSPGCASWDQFENYEQRGRAFAGLAGALWAPGVLSGA